MFKMSSHKCDDKCGGADRLNGFSILCSDCFNLSYLYCLQQNKEIKTLIKILNIEKTKGDVDKNTTIWEILNTMFASDSMFKFKCIECYHKDDEKRMDYSNSEQDNQVTHKELEAILKKYDDELEEKILSIVNDNHITQTRKRKRTITSTNGTNVYTPTLNVDLTSETQNKIRGRDLLKPPQIKNEEQSTYTIRISEFAKDTSVENIANYILMNTTIINPDLFKITFWENRDNENNTGISFKITTLKSEIKDQIMNENIWSPDYTATEILPKKRLQNSMKNKYINSYNTRYNKNTNNLRKPMDGVKYRAINGDRDNNTRPNRFQTPQIHTPNRRQIQFETPQMHKYMRNPNYIYQPNFLWPRQQQRQIYVPFQQYHVQTNTAYNQPQQENIQRFPTSQIHQQQTSQMEQQQTEQQ